MATFRRLLGVGALIGALAAPLPAAQEPARFPEIVLGLHVVANPVGKQTRVVQGLSDQDRIAKLARQGQSFGSEGRGAIVITRDGSQPACGRECLDARAGGSSA